MTNASASVQAQTAQAVAAEHRTWFAVLGVVLIALGLVAIAFPFVTTIAAKIFLGWLFLIGGVVQVVHAFSTQRWSAFFFDLLVGFIYVVAGAWLAFFPLTGIITLTIVLAALFIVEGVLEAGMAFRIRPKRGWAWLLVSGIVAIAVGVLIFAGLPSTAVWAVGLLVGINLLTSGLSYVLLASTARA
jgi:uncharacterized membrane protein HdeD (DUF308 family)